MNRSINCIDREGNMVDAYTVPTGVYRLLYNCAAGRLIIRGMIRPRISGTVGYFLNKRFSRVLIRPFIRKCRIDMSEYETEKYRSFNEFFRRKILPGMRPVNNAPGSIVSPCDGKVQIYTIDENTNFEIKNVSYTMEKLLRNAELAGRYRGGVLMRFHLGVNDYHHYAYPVDGTEGNRVRLKGILHTVNPAAPAKKPIYSENAREYTILDVPGMGKVLMMEVGALMVGKIVNVHPVGPVRRGEEKGYFEFGASSIILCFEKGAIIPDRDIAENTEKGYETLVKLGERIGRSGTAGAC